MFLNIIKKRNRYRRREFDFNFVLHGADDFGADVEAI
jgi:hypothetical protein